MSAPAGKLGGHGHSDSRLVGADNFVRHNPMSERFAMHDFDHVEIWCSDATNTAKRFQSAFGFNTLAKSALENGSDKYTSVVVGCGTIRFVFTAPYFTDAPKSTIDYKEPFPHYSGEAAWAFIKQHDLAVKTVAIQVDDAEKAYAECMANGGESRQEATTLTDEDGTIKYCDVGYYDDVNLRFIQGRKEYKGNFIPGYTSVKTVKDISFGLYRLDHIVSNMNRLTDAADKLQDMLGFHQFGEFTAADVGTVDSGLNSMVMASNNQMVLMPCNEPTFGTRRKSQIQSFIEHNKGCGIQHIAITTPDIIATMKAMHANAAYSGIEFMPNAGKAYYKDHVPQKMGSLVSQELIDECEKVNILIDRDEEGGLLQIFTKPLLDRPTLFFEIIQRIGCPGEDGKQKPACGGFGKGNFGALFKSIETFEKIRDGEIKEDK
jgi:4-hydroxyphenylpyruvate dioxygenase